MSDYDPTAKPAGGDLATYQHHQSDDHQAYAKQEINGSMANAQQSAQQSSTMTTNEGITSRW